MKSAIVLSLGASLVAASPAARRAVASEEFPILSLGNITKAEISGGVQKRGLWGPWMGVDFPDPSIIWGDGSWKAYATSSNGKRVPVAVSNDAVGWSLTGNDALPNPGSWVDAGAGIWAPDVQKNDAGVYVMYYTGLRRGGTHCVGVATSNTALGPFTARDQPLVCDDSNGGIIDPAGYDDGKDRWLMWKVDGNNLGGATTCQGGTPSGAYKPTPIKIQRMARDALTLLDSPKTILDNEGRNNNGVVEAPTLYKISDGNYVLFYSAHCYSSDDYDIEYAFSSTIDGPYTNRGILIRTVDNRGIFGPGGIDIDPNGRTVIFHGRTNPNQGNAIRQLYSATLNINGRSVGFA